MMLITQQLILLKEEEEAEDVALEVMGYLIFILFLQILKVKKFSFSRENGARGDLTTKV